MFIKTLKTTLLFCMLLTSTQSPAQNTSLEEQAALLAGSGSSVRAEGAAYLQNLLTNLSIPSSQVSFYVQPVNDQMPLFVHNAQRAQNPASLIKLVTSYAALKTLGTDYQWRTEFLSEGKPDANGVLSQPLYLKGSGDPQLVVEKVEELVKHLSAAGVKELRAPIIIDRSIFKNEVQDAASFDGEPSMPYNAQSDAGLMNFRAVSFVFDPVLQKVTAVPALSNYGLNDNVQWVNGACPADGWKGMLRMSNSARSATIGGKYYSDCGVQQWHVHAYQMSANDYVQGVLDGFMPPPVRCCNLKSEDINNPLCRGNKSCIVIPTENDGSKLFWSANQLNVLSVQDGHVPQNAQMIASVLSEPLSAQLKDMNHFSNNVMARQIYLSLSAKTQGVGSLGGSAQVVRDVMAGQGLSVASLNMGNGSGLSRNTAISAADLGAMLAQAKNETALYESLPVIGESGTVKNRLKGTDMVGRGRIKTGSLNDVRAIAGYIDGKSGMRYAVVSIIQGAQAQTVAGKKVHDAFMQWVGEQ